MTTKKKEGGATRTLRIVTPAGPIHELEWEDDGADVVTLTGVPEDEQGHWDQWYTLAANGKPMKGPTIHPAEGAQYG